MDKLRPSERLAGHIAQSLGGRLHGTEILTKCHNVALEMMEDRGLAIVAFCKSREELMRCIDETHPILRAAPRGGEEGAAREVLVFVDSDERTGVKLLRTLRDAHDDADLCIVNVDGATPFVKREMGACPSGSVEFWQVHELLFNPTKHALVPRHTRLSDAEVDELRREQCILETQFPAILATDVICRWYRFPKDAVLRIERSGLHHERGAYYRRVTA